MLKPKLKIIIICGPTATGKTSLALKLAAETAPASLISVDSRQLYRDLDILTGKDIPPDFSPKLSPDISYKEKPAKYFESASTRIWGVDLLSPAEDSNLSDFVKYSWQIIKHESNQKRQIILVGGTGLYLKAIFRPEAKIHLPRNLKLRQRLEKLSVDQLQQELKKINQDLFNQLNHSDQNNPRRLIRRIEVGLSSQVVDNLSIPIILPADFYWIGVKDDLDSIKRAIEKRVNFRLENGVLDEVKKIFLSERATSSNFHSALGVDLIINFLKGQISRQQLIKLWVRAESAYAKRQLVWFKKQANIIWYDKSTTSSIIINNCLKWLKKSAKK